MDGENPLDRSCKKWDVTYSQGEEYSTNNKEEEGYLNWSHLAEELPSERRYGREGSGKDRSDGKMKNKS
jgi:hypothetical protein